MNHEDIVNDWLQSKCGNSRIKDDVLDMMQQARIEAFNDVKVALMMNEVSGPSLVLHLTNCIVDFPDFKDISK